MNQAIAQRSEGVQQAIGETLSIAQPGLGGIMVTKAYNLVKVMDGRFRQANLLALWKGQALSRKRAVTDGASFLFGALPFLITFGFGGYLAITGRLSFGSLFMFINLLNYVANPLSSIPPLLASLSEGDGAAQRVYQLLDQEIERVDGIADLPAKETQTIVSFRGTNFAYEQEPVIRGVSFEVNRGQTIAIVGSSGGGKTTLLKLILGFYPLERGQISAFERDLAD